MPATPPPSTRRAPRVPTALAVLGAASTLWLAPSASAGVATVYQCSTPDSGPAGTDLLLAYNSPDHAAIIDCSGPSRSLRIESKSWGRHLRENDWARIDVYPSGRLVGGGLWGRQMYSHIYRADWPDPNHPWDSWAIGYRVEHIRGITPEERLIERCGAPGAFPGPTHCNYNRFGERWAGFDNQTVTLPAGLLGSGYTISYGCTYTSEYCWQSYQAGVRIGGIRLLVEDPEAPMSASGTGAVAQQDPITGTSLNVDAADRSGLGIHRFDLYVDDRLVRSYEFPGPACHDLDPGPEFAFAAGRPCLSSPSTMSLDIGPELLPEGSHQVEGRVLDAGGNTRVAFSRRALVDRLPNPTSIQAPAIAGNPKRPEWLTAQPGTWNGHGYALEKPTFAWQRCTSSGTECRTIAGATTHRYKLDAPDVGKRLRALVTATSTGGSTQAASELTDPIAEDDRCGGHPCDEIAVEFERDPGANGAGASRAARLAASTARGRRRARSGYGTRVMLRGRLVDERGAPIVGASVDVLDKIDLAHRAFKLRGRVLTRQDGSFSYLAPVGLSRTVRFAYRAFADDANHVAAADVELLVKARVVLKVSRRVTGLQPARFRGRVPGLSAGSLVELQGATDKKQWQTFKTLKLDRRGRFATTYTFRRTGDSARFLFRIRMPGGREVPLETGYSRSRQVLYVP